MYSNTCTFILPHINDYSDVLTEQLKRTRVHLIQEHERISNIAPRTLQCAADNVPTSIKVFAHNRLIV